MVALADELLVTPRKFRRRDVVVHERHPARRNAIREARESDGDDEEIVRRSYDHVAIVDRRS